MLLRVARWFGDVLSVSIPGVGAMSWSVAVRFAPLGDKYAPYCPRPDLQPSTISFAIQNASLQSHNQKVSASLCRISFL